MIYLEYVYEFKQFVIYGTERTNRKCLLLPSVNLHVQIFKLSPGSDAEQIKHESDSTASMKKRSFMIKGNKTCAEEIKIKSLMFRWFRSNKLSCGQIVNV